MKINTYISCSYQFRKINCLLILTKIFLFQYFLFQNSVSYSMQGNLCKREISFKKNAYQYYVMLFCE